MSVILSLVSLDPLGYWPATVCWSDDCTKQRVAKVLLWIGELPIKRTSILFIHLFLLCYFHRQHNNGAMEKHLDKHQ